MHLMVLIDAAITTKNFLQISSLPLKGKYSIAKLDL